MNRQDDLNTPVIAAVGFISTVLVFVIITLLMVVYYQAESRRQYETDISRPPAELAKLTAAQQAKLAKLQWIDREKGTVAIPINWAMELVVDEIRRDPEAASPKVEVPEEEPQGKAKEEGAESKAKRDEAKDHPRQAKQESQEKEKQGQEEQPQNGTNEKEEKNNGG